jgi:hypothetical protein
MVMHLEMVKMQAANDRQQHAMRQQRLHMLVHQRNETCFILDLDTGLGKFGEGGGVLNSWVHGMRWAYGLRASS